MVITAFDKIGEDLLRIFELQLCQNCNYFACSFLNLFFKSYACFDKNDDNNNNNRQWVHSHKYESFQGPAAIILFLFRYTCVTARTMLGLSGVACVKINWYDQCVLKYDLCVITMTQERWLTAKILAKIKDNENAKHFHGKWRWMIMLHLCGCIIFQYYVALKFT